jgi:hypothetical protein
MFHIDPIELASFVVALLSLLVGLLAFLSSLLIGAVQMVIATIAIWLSDKLNAMLAKNLDTEIAW